MKRKTLVCVDIKKAFLLALGFTREVYVKTPSGWTTTPDIYWTVMKPAYGLVDFPRLLTWIIDEWLWDTGFTVIPSIPQMFQLNEGTDYNRVLLVKVVDDLLIMG